MLATLLIKTTVLGASKYAMNGKDEADMKNGITMLSYSLTVEKKVELWIE
jgi:hypothetical protein